MKSPAPKLSELLYERMEIRADAGRAIAERAKACGGLTAMEARELRLLNIEQDQTRTDWAHALRDEGRRVNLLDPVDKFTNGIRTTNRGGDRPVIWLYGPIGERYSNGNSDEQFLQEFLNVPRDADVELHIRSDGGDFYTALAMREVIMSRPGKTFAFIDGLAASAATIIACACTEVIMSIGARYMIHEASGALDGRAEDFEKAVEQLKQTNATLVKIYSERWKGTRGQLLDALHAETWFSDTEAVQWGLADRISDKITLAASISREHGYKRVPSELRIAAKADECPLLMAYGLALHRCAIVH